MKTIKGSTNPKAEEKTFYELSDFIYQFENPLFGKKENEKHIWTLYKQVNNKWKQVSGKIKYGEKVPYTFGEKAVGISFKIEVHTESKNILNKIEKKLTASLVVVPRTKHEPVIGRVILLNRNNADVNKATFNESLSAEARTSNLVGKEITFYLWEEGATEEKKYQKPKTAKVDKNGIAKIKFKLSEYATPQTWMNFFSGNDNTTKKFFVSASYLSKEKTNKTPVSVTEAQQQQPPKQQAEKKEESTGFIEKATNIIAEGIGKIGDYVEEKTRTATSVGSGDVQENPIEENICKCCRIDEETFFSNYEKEFPRRDKKGNLLPMKESLKDSLKKVFTGISQYYSKEKRDCDIRKIAYMLATAKHETAHTFNPIKEYGGKSYLERMYDPILGKSEKRRSMALKNENTQQGDGVKYCGRGFVQLTWKKNYRKTGEKFGVDLISFPEKALEHNLAIKIMIYGSEDGTFTGKALGDYISLDETDYYNARRVINGIDKAATIQGYAEKIEKFLKIKKCKD